MPDHASLRTPPAGRPRHRPPRHRVPGPGLWLLLWLWLWLWLHAGAGLAHPVVTSEAAVKARMVLSLARFVQWPPGEAAESGLLRLCVAARQPEVSTAFAGLNGQSIAGRLVHVQPVPAPAAETSPCHVLFVHSSAERAAEALAQAGRSATLTVGDADGFLNRGGMVELMLVNDAVRFDISLRTMRTAQLAMSSQVLRLARQVRE